MSQGQTGDLLLLASFAEVAAKAPSVIQGMLHQQRQQHLHGPLQRNGLRRSARTVDNQSPSNANGTWYDHPLNNILWAALAESYAEVNAFDNQDGVSTQWTNPEHHAERPVDANVLNTLTATVTRPCRHGHPDTAKYGNLAGDRARPT